MRERFRTPEGYASQNAMRYHAGMLAVIDGRNLGDFITLVLGFGATACWLISAVNMHRMVVHRKPGVPMYRRLWANPFNIMFRPGDLTEKGLRARNLILVGAVGFFVCVLLSALIDLLIRH